MNRKTVGRICAFLLAVVLLAGILPAVTNAVSACENGHTAGEQKYSYTDCQTRAMTEYYICSICGEACDADGTSVTVGKHTPGSVKHEANYTECGGGYKTEFYSCTVCGWVCDENGNEPQYEEGTGKHTPGTKRYDANYTEYGGGFKTNVYTTCQVCGRECAEDGSELIWEQGTGVHTPGSVKYEADYTSCGGGYTTDYYVCTVCGCGCDENGSFENRNWKNPTDEHKLVFVPEKAATRNESGYKAHWKCSVCGVLFHDADGQNRVENPDDIEIGYEQRTATDAPAKTGDNPYLVLWIAAVVVFGAIGLAGILMFRKKSI